MGESGNDKVGIVTGGSRGIGRAVVEALAEESWRLFFCSRSERSVASAEAALRERFGERISGSAVDVRRQDEVDAFVAHVISAAGKVDWLVNNAGLGTFAPVDELTGDAFREVVETNLCGPFYFLRAVAPAMKRQGDGFIVNVGALAGKSAMAGGAAYNASKFGLIGMSEAAMLDLRQHGVRVAAVLPGSVETGFGGHGTGSADSWKLQPEDVAAAVLQLLSYPQRALPSLIELRPTRPPRK